MRFTIEQMVIDTGMNFPLNAGVICADGQPVIFPGAGGMEYWWERSQFGGWELQARWTGANPNSRSGNYRDLVGITDDMIGPDPTPEHLIQLAETALALANYGGPVEHAAEYQGDPEA